MHFACKGQSKWEPPKHKTKILFSISYGVEINYFNFNDLNSRLNRSYINDNISNGTDKGFIAFGISKNNIFHQVEIAAGYLASPDFNAYSTKQVAYYLGYKFIPDKRVSISGRLGIGITDFTLSNIPRNVALSYDSLLYKTSKSESVNLFSNNNLFIKPEIGINYRFKKTLFPNISETLCISVGYQVYLSQPVWYADNASRLMVAPFNSSGTPILAATVKLQNLK